MSILAAVLLTSFAGFAGVVWVFEPTSESSGFAFAFAIGGLVYLLIVIGWIITPQVLIVLFARDRLHAAATVFLMFIFFAIIALGQLSPSTLGPIAFSALLTWFLPVFLLAVAPAKAISRRLIRLALGLLLLIALNELSKLGLEITAPKDHG